MREQIVRCNNCGETIFGPSTKPISRSNVFEVFSDITKIPLDFNNKLKTEDKRFKINADIQLVYNGHDSRLKNSKDICSSCFINAIHDAIKKVVAERLEGGDK